MRNLNAAECVLSSMLVFSLHSSASVLSPPFNVAVKPRPHCVCICVCGIKLMGVYDDLQNHWLFLKEHFVISETCTNPDTYPVPLTATPLWVIFARKAKRAEWLCCGAEPCSGPEKCQQKPETEQKVAIPTVVKRQIWQYCEWHFCRWYDYFRSRNTQIANGFFKYWSMFWHSITSPCVFVSICLTWSV